MRHDAVKYAASYFYIQHELSLVKSREDKQCRAECSKAPIREVLISSAKISVVQ